MVCSHQTRNREIPGSLGSLPPRNDVSDDASCRNPDRAERDSDVVATVGDDGCDRHHSRISNRGDYVRDRRAGGITDMDRTESGARRFAPPAEAGLLNYLWPLLIVLFSSLLPGERLAPHHIIGAVLGLAGTVLLFAGNTGSVTSGQLPGLIAAFVAAFVWATYSVLSRRLKSVPTDAVAGFCAATALLAAIVHAAIEATVWPDTMWQWLSVIALGIGPVGAAFYAWDIGMKRGDIRVLGAASYATPLLSTAFLVMAGFAKPSANIAIAAVLIAGGGLIAAKDMIWKR